MTFNRRHVLIIILVLLIITIFLPIRVRYHFSSTARIYPKEEWKFSKGVNEGFRGQIYHHDTEEQSDIREYKFERGDIADLEINKNLKFDSFIPKGDTVAFLKSYFIENEIVQLKNLKDVQAANLGIATTGDKQTLVEQSRKRYDYAVQQLQLDKKIFARQEELFKDSVITEAEFEVAENTLKLSEINTQITYNEWMALSSGEKPTVVSMIEQQIKAYDLEIGRLEAQKKAYTILTPLEGILSYDNTDPEMLGILKVSNCKRLVVKIFIPVNQVPYLHAVSSVLCPLPDGSGDMALQYVGHDETTILILNRQYIIARAMTSSEVPGLFPGMIVNCRLECEKVTLFQYLKRNILLSL